MATAAKKSAAKAAPARKAAPAPARKPAAKAAKAAATPAVMKPVTTALSKQALAAHIATHSGVELKSVKAVLAGLEQTILASLNKKGVRSFTFPGLFKATTVSTPARPARKGINPFTKEEQMFAAKPASTKVRLRALKKFQEAAR